MAASAYLANLAVQSPATVRAILHGLTLVPAIAFGAAFLIMLFHPLSDRRFVEPIEEIKARRQR